MTDHDSAQLFPAESPPGDGLPLAAPDGVEVQQGGLIDDIIPSRGYGLPPVVALGGSAGSIPALKAFFSHAPAAAGLAYVVVLHLSPEHESTLPELLQRHTAMPVRAAEDGAALETDAVYVIPPGKHLTAAAGCLRLTDLQAEHGKRVAVDLFFRSLADSHGAHATAVVLSGADGDGAIGLKRVKERGGLTVAQDPQEAEHAGMPASAIATGMVDWVLRAADMPARIHAYHASEARLRLPSEDGPQPAKSPEPPPDRRETLLREVLAFLRTRTGHDFSYYKRATIVRRISRRMQVSGVQELDDYLRHLQTHPGEASALLQDLLVSVTNFFRDREAFEALEAQVPELFRHKTAADAVRVWCPACATGEEAYSMAMLLLEQARKLESPPALQVFGCDLSEEAIQAARAGFYPDTIAADVSDERLRSFFAKEPGGWRVRRELREMVLFATHDLLKDAPFSRMDLVSCRNLLIYLNRDAQKRSLEIFSFALKPGALLFLGSSESAEEADALVAPLDKKHRLYRRRAVVQPAALPLPAGGADIAIRRMVRQHEQLGHKAAGRPGRAFPAGLGPTALLSQAGAVEAGLPADELHFALLGRFGPPSLVVDAEHAIVHLSENASRFLQLPEGEPTRSLPRLVHPLLRIDLRTALLRAQETGEPAQTPHRLLELPGGPMAVGLRVAPAGELAPGFLLVLFDAREPGAAWSDGAPAAPAAQEPAAVEQLERELARAGANLRATVEQYEASTEELKASNEELQAMNEELRSAGEELETGREELQSVNEELTTVNAEFRTRMEELARANSDLHNLMSATQIATVFLGRGLQVMRYTPSAAPLFNLIPSDVGRPIGHLKHRLDYPDLAADAGQVLATLVPVERELRDGGRWFLARVLPYRTVDDRIAGVVLSFVDITERRRAEEARRESEHKYRTLFDSMDEGYCIIRMIHDEAGVAVDFRFLQVNRAFERNNGLRDAEGRTIRELAPGIEPKWMAIYDRVAQTGEPLRFEEESQALGRAFSLYAFRIGEPGEHKVAVIFTDITARASAEAALRKAETRSRLAIEAADLATWEWHLASDAVFWNERHFTLLGMEPHANPVEPGEFFRHVHPDDRQRIERELRGAIDRQTAFDSEFRAVLDGGEVRWMGGYGRVVEQDAEGRPTKMSGVMFDVTERKSVVETLERSRQALRKALQEAESARDDAQAAGTAKDHFLAILSHELRTPLTPVLLAAQLLMRNKALPADALNAAAIIQRNVRLETHLVDDLLDVTRITRGKMEIVRKPMSLHEAIARAVEVSGPDMEARGQHFTVELAAAEDTLSGDAERLQQVFWNLLKNASKFTPQGGEVHLRSRNEPGRIVVEVRDSGVGFAPGAAVRIFAAFEQADRNVTREHGGLGLGLAIARASVEAHGGSIEAASAGTGQGAVFTVELPLG